jgi:hypothetical protein
MFAICQRFFWRAGNFRDGTNGTLPNFQFRTARNPGESVTSPLFITERYFSAQAAQVGQLGSLRVAGDAGWLICRTTESSVPPQQQAA